MVAKPCEYTKSHWTVQFKMVNVVVCELYPNKKFLNKKIVNNGITALDNGGKSQTTCF